MGVLSTTLTTPFGDIVSSNSTWTEVEDCSSLLSNLSYGHTASPSIEQVKYVAYGIAMPVLVALGVLGDILNLVVLTRPNMTGVAYVYMRGYAAASLFALLCAIPFTHRILTHETGRWASYYVAAFHAHVVLYFGNSCIGIGVVMLLALTVERFISVCYPAQARNLCGAKRAYVTVAVIPLAGFLLYCPYIFIANVATCVDDRGELIHRKERNEWLVDSIWFQVYKWILELVFKLLPALVLVYLNVRIIRTYKAVCEKRRKMTKKVSGEQRRQYAEESRLMYLLGGTSTLFFVCMTPMIVLSVTIHRPWKNSLAFEIFRAIANVLEVTNFAVTFYIYCTFSKDFRETFLRTLRSAKENSMGASFLGSVSGLKEAIRPP
ncbi:probable G-protein coupled receptor B0563.6 [Penaeus chinensis]|uniref:probable G-protein coupled receptor B0563.6 n=1 Tax=Penaeus chinensis TaxID=139456 RepID=UPI001FB6BEB6|nr:probable G-protein coupled receptor B0563.6 [Penaeus chinensis]